jgi:hypothetical protein
MVLSLEDVAVIYGRTPTAIRHACKRSSTTQFNPKPFLSHPLRWRKADVLRHVQGARGAAA